MKRLVSIILAGVLLLAGGCFASPDEPNTDPWYQEAPLYAWNGTDWVNVNVLGGGSGNLTVEVDPVFSISPAAGIIAGDIATWNGHPLLTTGTHGVGAGDIVGTDLLQELTLKTLTSSVGKGTWTNSGVWKLPAWYANGDITTDRWLSNETNTFFGRLVIGAGSLAHTGGSEGYYNTAFGYQALNGITTGQANTAIGNASLSGLRDGNFNTAVGSGSMVDLVSGQYNTAVGLFSGHGNLGSRNVFIGYRTGYYYLGNDALFIDNTDTDTPLLGGDFSTNRFDIGGSVNMTTGGQINNLADPTLAQDAATKNYVDTHVVSNANYAEMYKYESTNVTLIQAVNQWHLINDCISGQMGGGWSHHIGSRLALTAQADNGDGKTQIACTGNGLINGDIVSIAGTTSYNGVWAVEQVTVNTFVISAVWVADEGAKTGEHGGHFHSAAATSAGKYLVVYTLSVKPDSANCQVEFAIYLNATKQNKSESLTNLTAVTDYQNVNGQAIVDIATNDIVGVAIKNYTDAGDFTIRYFNMTLVKLD